jgi:TolB-like protein/Flp pilus assembly protein TadD
MSGDSPKFGETTQSNISPEAVNPPLGRNVFISYASQDSAVANSMVETLEKHGVTCWIAPRDVVPGSLYADEIVGAINDTKVVVLVLSQHSIASPHVGKEIERASSKRHRIIAFYIDAVPLTRGFEYFLSESQWIDVGAGGMEGAETKLMEAVRRHLDPAAAIEPRAQSDAPIARAGMAPRTRWLGAGGSILLLALAYFVVHQFWLSKRVANDGRDTIASGSAATRAAPATDKSIAVLPFVDMSEKKDQEYFADGMAEEIIDLLVKIPGLKIIGRTSSFQFKGQSEDLRAIGNKLGVAYVLEGSVRKAGNRLRVTAQLIDTRDGTHRWSKSFDRDTGDVLKLQDEIAAGVARALEISVIPEDIGPRTGIRIGDAYDELLRGIYALDQWDADGMKEAANHFQHALELDPTSAGAAGYLAVVYDLQGEWGFVPPRVAFEQARRAAEAAIKLDPKLAVPHQTLAAVYSAYDWDWSAADFEIQQAIRLAPRDPFTLVMAARNFMSVGRFDEALSYAKAALAQDPLSPPTSVEICWIQQRLGHWVEAEAAARRALEISPTYAGAHYYLGITLLNRGEREAALREFQKEPDNGSRLGGIAMADSALGRRADSDSALRELLKSQAGVYAFGIAEVYAFRGGAEQALQWLEHAYTQKDPVLYMIKGDPPLKSLEADPRFKTFLRKMNLPD